MITTIDITYILISYLGGSIPVGYLLTKYSMGINITRMGSGNIGSTNVGRVAGKKASIITQLLDMSKGLLPVTTYIILSGYNPTDKLIYCIALAAIIGHDFSIFLKFKGGKGVNTTLGASVVFAPIPVFIAVGIYFITKWRFKYVSLSSIMLSISLPVSAYILYGLSPVCIYLMVCCALILITHRQNILRLINHQELLP
ncbi:glycerol-3-phosphate 1-O-acyltransferase [Puteibacter caeruleilacunae]|nr:glycerol-3-phosphate 1-O-acyltransferase [Puteibacter caeruleilacunae]